MFIINGFTVTEEDSAKLIHDLHLWETSIKVNRKQHCLFFDPEKGGDMFLRIVG
jgi:hypothetical protein